ncbi:MAG: TVP38/TMEM64 family protein [Haloarculaceae archaeon]
MQLFSSREARRRGVLAVLLVAVFLVALYLGIRRYASFVFDAEELRVWLAQFGVLAPLVFVLLQFLQVVFAPIPGQVVALVAGYLFGPLAGTAYSLVGVLAGSAVAFSLAQWYGRGFVDSLLHEEVMDSFDGFVDQIGLPGLVAFVLIPGLPDDAICFLAGLTKWRLRTFMVAITIGRLPAYVITVYAGDELAGGRIETGLGLIGVVVVLSVLGYHKQDAIRNRVERLEERFLP